MRCGPVVKQKTGKAVSGKNMISFVRSAIPYCFSIGVYFLIYEGLGGCPIDRIFRLECPGCGCMRAGLMLIHGDFRGSFSAHPFCVPYILAILAGYLPLRKGKRISQWYVVLTACAGLAYYLMK